MLANADIRLIASQVTPLDMQDQVKMLVTKLIDEFILKMRLYVQEKLQVTLAGQDIIALTADKMPSKRLSTNSEEWDLGTLVQIFHVHQEIFKHDFGGEVKQVIPVLMQIKEMRNRRVHNVSRTLAITAREAYSTADLASRFFELMIGPVDVSIHQGFRALRREALQMLYVEELHRESVETGQPQPVAAQTQQLQHHQQQVAAPTIQQQQQLVQQPTMPQHQQNYAVKVSNPTTTSASASAAAMHSQYQPNLLSSYTPARMNRPRYNDFDDSQVANTRPSLVSSQASSEGNQAMGFAYTENEFEVIKHGI